MQVNATEVEASEKFLELVQTLLKDSDMKEHFFEVRYDTHCSYLINLSKPSPPVVTLSLSWSVCLPGGVLSGIWTPL